ncbi:hypothetical protein [Mycobacterium sp. OTB74]|uniref:hypothetical protein n=1 Tax=Mycobacterium sp. OTB74 TaxID=1853452 RepID=UPI0024764AD1|nr:hypothetical protein [Mycobacterium sp. OTB74]MDH6242888.1 hypothetical protein [Mycobacterium sp. OTB74]
MTICPGSHTIVLSANAAGAPLVNATAHSAPTAKRRACNVATTMVILSSTRRA